MRKATGWVPKVDLEGLVKDMVDSDIEALKNN